MKTLKIGGKDYPFSVTWGRLTKVTAKMKDGEDNNIPNLITMIWEYLDRGLLFKPFIFKFRIANKITMSELVEADKIIAEVVSMEDREGGNSEH